MDSLLWGVIAIVVAIVLLVAIVPEYYGRRQRNREKRLNHRAKRRIEL